MSAKEEPKGRFPNSEFYLNRYITRLQQSLTPSTKKPVRKKFTPKKASKKTTSKKKISDLKSKTETAKDLKLFIEDFYNFRNILMAVHQAITQQTNNSFYDVFRQLQALNTFSFKENLSQPIVRLFEKADNISFESETTESLFSMISDSKLNFNKIINEVLLYYTEVTFKKTFMDWDITIEKEFTSGSSTVDILVQPNNRYFPTIISEVLYSKKSIDLNQMFQQVTTQRRTFEGKSYGIIILYSNQMPEELQRIVMDFLIIKDKQKEEDVFFIPISTMKLEDIQTPLTEIKNTKPIFYIPIREEQLSNNWTHEPPNVDIAKDFRKFGMDNVLFSIPPRVRLDYNLAKNNYRFMRILCLRGNDNSEIYLKLKVKNIPEPHWFNIDHPNIIEDQLNPLMTHNNEFYISPLVTYEQEFSKVEIDIYSKFEVTFGNYRKELEEVLAVGLRGEITIKYIMFF